KCFTHLLYCDQVSDRKELSFRIFFSEFSYSVDVCAHKDSSPESRYVSFQQIRTPASPFPPVDAVAAPYREPCGSPSSSVLWGRKTVFRFVYVFFGRFLVVCIF